jgi:hypothetical protein
MPCVSAQLTYRAYFPGGMMFMLPAGLTVFAVCTFPTPFFLFFAAFAIMFGCILSFRTAWTIRLEGDELRWRSVFQSGRLPVQDLRLVRIHRSSLRDVDTMFASQRVVFTWRDGRSVQTMTGPGFSWLVENLIALVPGLQIEWGRYWVEHRWNRGQ